MFVLGRAKLLGMINSARRSHFRKTVKYFVKIYCKSSSQLIRVLHKYQSYNSFDLDSLTLALAK